MKLSKLYSLLICTLVLVSCEAKVSTPEIVPINLPVITEPSIPEGQKQVLKVMEACNVKLSEALTKIRAAQISQIAEAMFDQEDRRWFYVLICIESKFNTEAKSAAGATGLTQIIPAYAKEFAKNCNLGELDIKDIQDSQVNLLVGACRFKELMAYYGGDPALALAAYNSGLNSITTKKAANLDIRTGHPETVGYLAAAFVLEQKLQR